MKRVTHISSTGKIEFFDYERNYKKFEPSITDKSSFTTVEDQLRTMSPMTDAEIESHYDFIAGQKDDGRLPHLKQDADLSERLERIKNMQKDVKGQIDKAAKKTIRDAKLIEISQKTESQLLK